MRASLPRLASRLIRQPRLRALPLSNIVRPSNRFYCTDTPKTPQSTVVENETPPVPEDDFVDDEPIAEEVDVLIKEDEQRKGPAETFGFQAETKQLLEIVAKSLYTDKEIFIRELISNASDALEKSRHTQLVAAQELEDPLEAKIQLAVDPELNTFTIQDTGIGMTREELQAHLGTIARSGSKAFMENLKEGKVPSDAADSIIGQFGVGFYSCFICAVSVRVYTKSLVKGSVGYLWESDGSGEYAITEAEGVTTGTKIVVQLKETETQFASQSVVERIIKKYSNFIGFPILLNGKRVNTVDALWRKEIKSVTDEQHSNFFQFITSSREEPMYRLHYKVDAPMDLNAVFYIGQSNNERFGVARLEPNISLYCRKVLIQAKSKDVLPEWMRFVHGVVDSEDLPLNISRENSQDSAQIRKLNTVCTKRILKWLDENAKKDPTEYDKFFNVFGTFLKEGACMDAINKPEIAKLLRFESSKKEAGELISLDDYVERMLEGQEKIYFLHTPNRQAALLSPYIEQFQKKGVEVLFLHGHIDEYVMSHVEQFKSHSLYAVENPDTDLDKIKGSEEATKDVVDNQMDDILTTELSTAQCTDFGSWMKNVLEGKLYDAKVSTRLVSSPAVIVTGHEQAAMHRMMKQMNLMSGKTGAADELPPQVLEYNPRSIIIKKLHALSKQDDALSKSKARNLAEQLFDNALIAAGLLDDPRLMLKRLNALLETALADVEEESMEHADEVPKEDPKETDEELKA